MDRNHYEAAFEGYLQWHRLCYVAVDETVRSVFDDFRMKSLDFIVHGEGGVRLLVDVKGRRFPAGPEYGQWRAWNAGRRRKILAAWTPGRGCSAPATKDRRLRL